MTNDKASPMLSLTEGEQEFHLLCLYNDIITSQSNIVENDQGDRFYLYKVIPPFPSYEEFRLGVEFDEDDLPIAIYNSLIEIQDAQRALKSK